MTLPLLVGNSVDLKPGIPNGDRNVLSVIDHFGRPRIIRENYDLGAPGQRNRETRQQRINNLLKLRPLWVTSGQVKSQPSYTLGPRKDARDLPTGI